MSCCAPGAAAGAMLNAAVSAEEIMLASRDLGEGLKQTDLSVPGMHCGQCIRTVEAAVAGVPGVEQVRANLTARRVSVKWRGQTPPGMVAALAAAGYTAHPQDAMDEDRELRHLIIAMAIAGFAAMNIMMLSVSVWSGADAGTRQAFHLISAALALPAILYSGSVFYRSAWRALSHGRTNMDVPISVGIAVTYGLSLYDTLYAYHHAYFDAATTLIFILLVGRTLDHMMRQRARSAINVLMRLSPRGATLLHAEGGRDYVPLSEIEPGMMILISPGERVPVDGCIVEGRSRLDCAIATGESAPVAVKTGSTVQAGALNLTGPLKMVALARAKDSFIAEMLRLMEAAEGGRARYRQIADRAARLYTPAVHIAALLTFLGWLSANGDWHQAISIAITVLIITCPCALGLAVPIVQVVAARRLFDAGVMVKDGSAIERLAEVDTVAFDKTGTLTVARTSTAPVDIDPAALATAASMAQYSAHPASRAITQLAGDSPGHPMPLASVTELAGYGLEARIGADTYRLGRASWALEDAGSPQGTVLARNGELLARFEGTEVSRPGAIESVRQLRDRGFELQILSGDRQPVVAALARRLGISHFKFGLLPRDKVEHLQNLAASGHRVLMVGDGLNDVPALAAAHVSMAPATAADVGRSAADFVFLRDSLEAVPLAIDISRRAGRFVRQNFAIAIVYNILAVPIAVAGQVTPLIAAIAMSLSSIAVVANALRLQPAEVLHRANERPAPAMKARQTLAVAK